jgi:hypothetical protein
MRVSGECSVCGGQNGNHAGWCGHGRAIEPKPAGPAMSARPGPFRTHVADQILAALADAAPMPLSTPQIENATGYGARHGQLTYQVLTRLAKAGQVERSAAPGIKPVYWRTLATSEIDPASMPPLTVRSQPDASS